MNTDNWVETNTARIRLRDDGIVELAHQPMAMVTLEDARENVAMTAKLLADAAPLPLLMDLRSQMGISADARDFINLSDQAFRISRRIASLVGNPVSCVLGNAFIALNTPCMDRRFFTNERKAIEWLKQHEP